MILLVFSLGFSWLRMALSSVMGELNNCCFPLSSVGFKQKSVIEYVNAAKIRFIEKYLDRKSTRLNSSHSGESRMPSSA